MWKPVQETPMKKFDLMMAVNVRGAYAMVQEVLPHFLSNKSGKIVLVAPPIYNRYAEMKRYIYTVSLRGYTCICNILLFPPRETCFATSCLFYCMPSPFFFFFLKWVYSAGKERKGANSFLITQTPFQKGEWQREQILSL